MGIHSLRRAGMDRAPSEPRPRADRDGAERTRSRGLRCRCPPRPSARTRRAERTNLGVGDRDHRGRRRGHVEAGRSLLDRREVRRTRQSAGARGGNGRARARELGRDRDGPCLRVRAARSATRSRARRHPLDSARAASSDPPSPRRGRRIRALLRRERALWRERIPSLLARPRRRDRGDGRRSMEWSRDRAPGRDPRLRLRCLDGPADHGARSSPHRAPRRARRAVGDRHRSR